MADIMVEDGRKAEAVDLARQILDVDPDNAQAQAIIGGVSE